jgi:hypothetical protein
VSRVASEHEDESSGGKTLSDHISEAIDELHQLEPLAAGWRNQNQSSDLIDDINRIGRRLARVGRA